MEYDFGRLGVTKYLLLIQRVKENLTPDLLNAEWRKLAVGPLDGHCYVASEAVYWLMGREDGYRPHVLRMDAVTTHWFLKNDLGTIIDPTAKQFPFRVNYEKAKPCGFLTKQPSKRCRTLMSRITEHEPRSART